MNPEVMSRHRHLLHREATTMIQHHRHRHHRQDSRTMLRHHHLQRTLPTKVQARKLLKSLLSR